MTAAPAEEIVYRAGNQLFVAGNGVGRDDHRVAGDDLNLPVLGVEMRVRADMGSLAARGQDDQFIQRDAVDPVQLHHDLFREVEIAELEGNAHRVLQAASGNADLAAVALGRVDDLLDAMDVGGESGKDDPPLAEAEDLVNGRPHFPLRLGVAGAIGIGTVHQGHENVAPPQLGELVEVCHLAVHGGVIELKVAGVDGDARWSV